MNRREVLKTIPYILGCTVATPTLLQLLVSCKNDANGNYNDGFLNKSDAFTLNQIVDVILPKTQTVGALDVHVPQFVNRVLKAVLTKDEQDVFSKGQHLFKEKFQAVYKIDIQEATTANFMAFISVYFKVSEKQQQQIFKILNQPITEVENKDMYYIYSYLTTIRYYALYGYYTSERVGVDILNYNPTPGMYHACVPVNEVGNSSSI